MHSLGVTGVKVTPWGCELTIFFLGRFLFCISKEWRIRHVILRAAWKLGIPKGRVGAEPKRILLKVH